MDAVTVRVPATIANLGPGFDCLGLAVAWHNRVTLERGEGGTVVEASGHGAERIPRDESNLVVRAVRAYERAAGTEPGAWTVRLDNGSPYGRGLGSSAAAIVGGLVAAREVLGGDANLLQLAGEIEGHLDNVAPALMGGLVVSGFAPGDALRVEPPPELSVLVCVAAERLSTKTARGVLPQSVPFADAVFNASRAALLAATVASGADPSRLLAATEDRLHQDARFGLAPDTKALVAALRSAGHAAFLSGAGPSVAALVPGDLAAAAEDAARDAAPDGWEVRVLGFDRLGAIAED